MSAIELKNTQNFIRAGDNEILRRELKKVIEENRKLKNIISYGSISTLSTLIDQYMDYSRIHLKKNSDRNTINRL